jgi:hypothetical protein
LKNIVERVPSARRRPYHQRISKLARYRAEIATLFRGGASIREIQAWLKQRRRETRSAKSPLAAVSTIHAFVRSLPELSDV